MAASGEPDRSEPGAACSRCPPACRFPGVDLLDGTPVLDLKPYVSRFDRPDGEPRCGWFDEVDIADGVTPADLGTREDDRADRRASSRASRGSTGGTARRVTPGAAQHRLGRARRGDEPGQLGRGRRGLALGQREDAPAALGLQRRRRPPAAGRRWPRSCATANDERERDAPCRAWPPRARPRGSGRSAGCSSGTPSRRSSAGTTPASRGGRRAEQPGLLPQHRRRSAGSRAQRMVRAGHRDDLVVQEGVL